MDAIERFEADAALRVMVLTGAGVSTDCGIPDYRDAMGAYETVGVTAGASTPEFLIAEVCRKLESW